MFQRGFVCLQVCWKAENSIWAFQLGAALKKVLTFNVTTLPDKPLYLTLCGPTESSRLFPVVPSSALSPVVRGDNGKPPNQVWFLLT